MGIDASNNIKIKQQQQEKDSPFLTLSERNKKGLSSQNIFGGDEKAGQAQDPKRTERIPQLNIFGAEEGGQVKDDTSVFGQQEEKGCDEYFEENAQGEMNFDTNGFYGDAIGVSFGNSGVSNPIAGKTGSSDIKGLESELKLMLRSPEQNKTQIENLKQQINAQGGDADKIIAENTPKAGSAKGAKTSTKAEATENGAKATNNGTKQTGSTEEETTGNSAASSVAGLGSLASSNTSTSSFMSGVNAITTDVSITPGTKLKGSSTTAQGASKSSKADGGDTIATNIVTTLMNKGMETASSGLCEGLGVNALGQKIGNGLKEGVKGAGKLACKAVGIDLDEGKAGNAETVDEAKKNVQTGENASKAATTENATAKGQANNANIQADTAKQDAARAKVEEGHFEATEEQQIDQAEWQEHEEAIQKATGEEKAAIKEAKQKQGETLTADIKSLETEIEGYETEVSGMPEPDDTGEKSNLQSLIATKKAVLAEKQAALAKCKQEEALVTEQKAEAERLAKEAGKAAEAAKDSAEGANAAAEEAKRIAENSHTTALKFETIKNGQIKIAEATEKTIQKADVFTEASREKLQELNKSNPKK